MIDTQFYERCINTLERGFNLLQQTSPESVDHDLYRSACVKEFEIILEQSGKLLKRALRSYYSSRSLVDKMYFNELFRNAGLKGLIEVELAERFLEYRDLRNSTAHDYGVNFAEETLQIVPKFIEDARAFVEAINQFFHDSEG